MPTLLLRVAITAATKNTMYMFISRMGRVEIVMTLLISKNKHCVIENALPSGNNRPKVKQFETTAVPQYKLLYSSVVALETNLL